MATAIATTVATAVVVLATNVLDCAFAYAVPSSAFTVAATITSALAAGLTTATSAFAVSAAAASIAATRDRRVWCVCVVWRVWCGVCCVSACR